MTISADAKRRAMSLVELLAVVTLLGILTAIAALRVGKNPQKAMSANTDARRLAMDITQCQRRAISTGKNHFLSLTMSGTNVQGYTLYQRTSSTSTTAVDAYRSFDQGETVTTTSSQIEFAFDGTALAAYTVTFTKPSGSTVVVSVVPASGAVRVQ